MNYIQNIEFNDINNGITNSSVEKIGIKINSIIGVSFEGGNDSVLSLFKSRKCRLIIDGTDIFETQNYLSKEEICKTYSWINEVDTLIENCTINENLQLAAQLNNGRSPQLLLKQMEVDMIADLLPRNLSSFQYIVACLLSALARGSRYIFVDCTFEDYDSVEIESIINIMKKCTDYFDRTIFIINPNEKITDKLEALCKFKIV